uniref:BRCT domain-containing protein n=1 Tax=Angiostrongylus cantonensis TaxID=6313 RepID=A0A0K0DA52_ANGCA
MSAPGAPKKSRRSHESIPDFKEDDVQPIDVFCVEPSDPSITKNELDYYLETFTVRAVWLSEEKALEVSSNDDAFYFVAVFRGRVFEHLKKIGVNIGGCLPRWDFPVYALNLTGACVCFTGLSLQKREELKVKTNYMNGVVSPSLTEKVTHLVTDYCDTEARRMGLPIMSPLWIDQAWEAAQAFSLENFVITATGVGGRERMDIARLIELNGGRFSGDMKRNECTHLIADKTRGVKFKKAREWNTIKIVRSSWLRKSVIAGYVLPERY